MAQKNMPHFIAERFLHNLKTGSKAVEYKKKSLIFVQGDPAQAVLYIRKGRVELTVTSEQGKAAVIGVLNGGSFFGEGCICRPASSHDDGFRDVGLFASEN